MSLPWKLFSSATLHGLDVLLYLSHDSTRQKTNSAAVSKIGLQRKSLSRKLVDAKVMIKLDRSNFTKRINSKPNGRSLYGHQDDVLDQALEVTKFEFLIETSRKSDFKLNAELCEYFHRLR